MTGQEADLVVITWNGKDGAHQCYSVDEPPEYTTLLFDFSGKSSPPEGWAGQFLSIACECKGDIYNHTYDYILRSETRFRFVALFDDDIEVRSSQINQTIRLGLELGLDCFAPSLSRDSYYSFEHTRNIAGSTWHRVDFLEVMMPFYPYDLFMAGGEFYKQTISAHGLDHFTMAMFQRLMDRDTVGIIDAVVVRHTKPVTSQTRTFRNGLTAFQERVRMRTLARRYLHRHRPDLIGTLWYMRCFASLGGPGRFWGPWAIWPLLWLRGAIARHARG